MTGLRVLLGRLLGQFRAGWRDDQLNDEIEAHLDLLAKEHVRRGISPREARLAARREFGGLEQMKEVYRDQRALPLLETTWQDLRYTLRTFRKNPGFVTVVMLSLSLGIGINSAIFSILNALLLRPLPVRSSEELFVALPDARVAQRFSYPAFEQLRRATPDSTLAAMSHVARMFGVIRGERESRATAVQLVSGEYFSLLGVSPRIGRALGPDDNRNLGAHPVAVISDGFWRRAFGGTPDVVGRGMTVNGTDFTIVGVGAPGFSGVWLESPVDVWIPLMMQAEVHYSQNFSSANDANNNKPWIPQQGITWLDIIGREKTSGSDHVRASLRTAFGQILARQAEQVGDPDRRRRFLQQRLAFQPFGQGFSNLRIRFTPPLLALLGMAGLVLLIACANTVNLLLARAAARQHEMAIRLSLGASRGRLIRQLLTESVLLVGMAAAVGLALARWAGDLLVRQTLGASGTTPFAVGVDGRVLAFTMVVSVLTGLLFGLAPAFRTTKLQLGTTLKRSASSGAVARPRVQTLLVASQVALSLTLLVGAGLFVRTLQNYARIDVGFAQEHVLSVWITPAVAGYSGPCLSELYRELVERVQSLPGVSSASVAMCGLASNCRATSDITIAGYQPRLGEQIQVQENRVGTHYFVTTGMRLAEGRDFEDRDTGSPRVAIVNRAMVQRYFPQVDAVGKRFGYRTPDTEIIGVVEDARVNRVQDPPEPMAFYPMGQDIVNAGTLDVRAVGDPRSIVMAVRRAVADVDGSLPIDRVTILSEQLMSGLNQERVVAGLTTVFGILALGLACFGLFGVMSYAVAGRTAEFGIRMALGAQRWRVVWAVLREAFSILALGLAAGIPAVLATSRLLSDLIFGVDGSDPLTLSLAVSTLVAVAAIASVIPAWRASRVDPMVALRCE